MFTVTCVSTNFVIHKQTGFKDNQIYLFIVLDSSGRRQNWKVGKYVRRALITLNTVL